MNAHPLSGSWLHKAVFILLATAAAASLGYLLVRYAAFPGVVALADSLSYVATLALTGYLYGFTAGYLRNFQPKVASALLAQILALGVTFAAVSLFGSKLTAAFADSIPLHLPFGLLGWLSLALWYELQQPREETLPEEQTDREEAVAEKIERIPVKDNAGMRIIPVAELLYIQAYGDYVLLFTESGKHIKEQTMRYFETHLPEHFIRIHRSCIVNGQRIARIELSGKENYRIRLQNGEELRASSAGYKLLKERFL